MDALSVTWLLPGTVLAFALALLVSSAGFYRVVYFISTGYAFSITAMAVASGWVHRHALEPLVMLQLALLALYGLRLGGFLLRRERSASYRKEREDIEQNNRQTSWLVRVAIWVSVSVLYVLMFYPALANLAARHAGDGSLGTLPLGLLVMALGLGLEAWADRQKSRYKAAHPDRFCDVGLFSVVRCPNYLGEMIFWLGQCLTALAFFSHWAHGLASVVGLVCIELIMVGSTKRLEHKQDERYGHREDYRRYVRRVPVLLPWVPLYSVKNARIYLG